MAEATHTTRTGRTRRLGARRVWLLIGGVGLAGAGLYGGVVRHLESLPGFRIPWLVLAAAFALAEISVVHLPLRREAFSFSLSEIPLVIGLFTVSPTELLLANLVGSTAALVIHRRQSLLKLTFNLAHFTLATCLAVVLFRGLLVSPFGIGPLLAAFGVLVLTTVAGDLLIAAAVRFTEGALSLRSMLGGLWLGAVVSLANTSVALLVVIILSARPEALWLLMIPAATVFFAYRGYASQRQQNEALGHLYESTRRLQRSLKVEATARALLHEARQTFRAEVGELVLLPAGTGEQAMRAVLGPEDREWGMEPADLDPGEGVWARVVAEGRGVLLPRPIRDEELRSYFARRGLRDVMVAPVHDEGRVVGVLTVANRAGTVSTFDPADLRLFETLANHASVSLKNAQLVTRLEESLERLTEMNRMKDDFIATVSHELRTPLASVLGFVKLMRSTKAPLEEESRQEFLALMEAEGLRLHELVEDLLSVTQIDHGQIRVSPEAVDINRFLRDLAQAFAPRMAERDLHIQTEAGLPPAWTHEGLLRKIVSNFVDNALKYSPEGAPITVLGRRDGDGIVVSVTDRGPGIPQEEHERIFDRFYQVDQSIRRRVGGTGLGLYICRRAAEVLGGRVWLERSGPGGSVFSVCMPAAPSAAVTGELLSIGEGAGPGVSNLVEADPSGD